MMSPLVLFPDATVALPPRLFAPALYYAAMASHGKAVVDTSLRYDKRCKEAHRYAVADVRGRLDLTVPVGKPSCQGRPTWADAPVSRHGNWWHVHRVTLESAYGRTPFFEFIIDKFDHILADPGDDAPSALELARRADAAVRSILGIDADVTWREALPGETFGLDLRSRPGFDSPAMPPYYQVRDSSLGFIDSLSVLDIIFNLGDEAPLYIRQLAADNF